jgi:predicted DNA-binding transcriptional regulator AlpA
VKKKKKKTIQPVAPLIPLDQPGRLRFCNVMALLSISHQTVYNRMESGQVPRPDGYDGKRPYWNTATIRVYLEQ